MTCGKASEAGKKSASRGYRYRYRFGFRYTRPRHRCCKNSGGIAPFAKVQIDGKGGGMGEESGE